MSAFTEADLTHARRDELETWVRVLDLPPYYLNLRIEPLRRRLIEQQQRHRRLEDDHS